MQKTIFLLFYGVLAGIPNQSFSQILVTEMGPVRYFNTLDSAQAVGINAVAAQCYCFLRIEDSTHQKLLRLDIKIDTFKSDSSMYVLDYNNLAGNYSPTDSLSESPGIYIRARDSAIKPQIILRLLDYGIRHYTELKERNKKSIESDQSFLENLLKQKTSYGFRRAVNYCK